MVFEETGQSKPWDSAGYLRRNQDLTDLVFDRRKKDSPELGTVRIGKENDIWDSDERSLGCGILVKKEGATEGSGPSFPEPFKSLSSL